MKKLIVSIFILLTSVSLQAQVTDSTLPQNFEQNYTLMLEHYLHREYVQAWQVSEQLLEMSSDEVQVEKIKNAREIIQDQLSDKALTREKQLKKKRFDEGLIYYWIKNITYLTASFETLPTIFQWHPGIELTSGMTLLGIGSGIATSILTMQDSSMTWGRAMAVDFFTIWAGMNTEALVRALIFPDATAYYQQRLDTETSVDYPLVNSVFPYAFSRVDYNRANLVFIDVFTLTARYLAISMTRDKDLSAGKYSLLLNAYGWSTFFTTTVLNSIQKRQLFFSEPNPYNFLIGNLVGDVSVYFLNKYYHRLNYTPRQVWLSSLFGGITIGTGLIFTQLERNEWINDNSLLVSMLWAASGIYTGMKLFDENESSGRSAMMFNTYLWTSYLIASTLGDISPGDIYQTVLTPLISATAAGLIHHYYPDLQWSTTRSWLVSLSGGLGVLTGVLTGNLFHNNLVASHPSLYYNIFAVAGLAIGSIFTKNMAAFGGDAGVRLEQAGVELALMPRVGTASDVGADLYLFKQF